jgi:hypothetical protein
MIRVHSCLPSRNHMKAGLIETRSAPALTRCYPHSFTFYLGNPFPRFVVNELR